MINTYLVASDSDPIGNAVEKLLTGTAGFERVLADDSRLTDISERDVLLAGEGVLEATASGVGLVQFLGCRPSISETERFIAVGAKVVGISPIIGSRVANRAVGFGGPLRVKPDAKWGIVGFGDVGREVAKKLVPTEAKVEIADVRTPKSGSMDELEVRRQSLDLLLTRSDAVSLHVRSGPTADPLISDRELKLMKPGAALINTSDSSIVDEKAIIEALSSGVLGGYATDCSGDVILNADDSLVSSGKLMVTTNPLTNQIGAAQQVAKYVAANISAFAEGAAVQGTIELIDFPAIGDPSFWSSQMSPRQD
jgi:hypothetical protein